MKKAEDIRTIAITGAGVMGSGIAVAALQSGYKTILFDVNATVLEKAGRYVEDFFAKSVEKGKLTADQKAAYMAALTCTGNLAEVKADLIVEAILENLEIKRKLFADLEAQNDEDCILATNTSTIPVTRIAAGVKRPHNVVGMHFFNPAPLMKLVEVISGERTAPEVAETIHAVAQKMGKTPVQVKDEPGFVVNRVARHFYLESLKVTEEKVASFEAVDRLMMASGFKMGPFQLMDLIGVETNHEVTKSLYEAFFHDEKFRPSRVQQKKVDAGQFGRKTGQGFYTYEK
jgi:3-hydroxybutyryl-CoA dehydrogenase